MSDLPIPGTARPQHRAVAEPRWTTDGRLSRLYLDEHGDPVRYYTVGALALALGKRPVTVRKWISRGIIPDASMRTANVRKTLGETGRRLYTREQIEAMVAIARSEGVAGPEGEKIRTFTGSAFSVRVWSLWRQRNW